MKRIKGNPLIQLAVISLLASSCVYSLFPLYTEDKVVFIPDIVGTWVDVESEDGSDSIRFESLLMRKSDPTFASGDPRNTAGYTIADLRKTMDTDDLADMLDQNSGWFSPDYTDVDAARYKMTIYNGSEEPEEYQVYISDLGDHLFVDAYPYGADSDFALGNRFPVHTFYKIELIEEQLIITMFDLEKLFKLFESNLIRLRHEIVDDQVLITARPEELQRFLARYSKDDSVFDPDQLIQRKVTP